MKIQAHIGIVTGPNRINSDAVFCQLYRQRCGQHTLTILARGVRVMATQPLRIQIHGRTNNNDVWLGCMRQITGRLAAQRVS